MEFYTVKEDFDEYSVIENELNDLKKQRIKLDEKIHLLTMRLDDKKEKMINSLKANKAEFKLSSMIPCGQKDKNGHTTVILKSETFIHNVLKYIYDNKKVNKKQITEVFGRATEVSKLVARGFAHKDKEENLFFVSWRGISDMEYRRVAKHRITAKELTSKITSFGHENSIFTTRELAIGINISKDCALFHLRRLEDTGAIDRFGRGWSVPGVIRDASDGVEEADGSEAVRGASEINHGSSGATSE